MRIFVGENKYADPQDFREVIHALENAKHKGVEIVRWDISESPTRNLQHVKRSDLLLILVDSKGQKNDGVYYEATIGKGTYGMAAIVSGSDEQDEEIDLSGAPIYFYSQGFVLPSNRIEMRKLNSWRDYGLLSSILEPDQSPLSLNSFLNNVLEVDDKKKHYAMMNKEDLGKSSNLVPKNQRSRNTAADNILKEELEPDDDEHDPFADY
jgi:hypothetical protein